MKGFVKIFTYGCQMNDLDTQKMYSMLYEAGWHPTEDLDQADIIFLNTCSVRQKPYEKVLSNLGRLKYYKERKPNLILGVTGCVAQQEGKDIIEKLPFVDIVLGTHQLHKLPEMIQKILASRAPVAETRFEECIPLMDVIPAKRFLDPAHRAYINIMQGCNNYCSYCIVPYVRGKEISRNYKDVLNEAKTLADMGAKEIFLLGQNVNSYSGGITFADLLKRINDVEGVERIRFTTSHPKDMSDELIGCFANLEKLCNNLHLPFQAGSDRVLEAMNRGYTQADYLRLIEKLRKAQPDMAFSADVMVGFPTETESDFMDTMHLIEQVRFDVLFSFKYSPRPGTRAALIPDDVTKQEKERRLAILQTRQRQITIENNRMRVGKIFDVMVDGISKRSKDAVFGRTTHSVIVNFKGPQDLIGKTVKVKIERANPNSLTGVQDGL
jgi:tRNA-2-methylthio-N6-dimethylallyladenosine synthase